MMVSFDSYFVLKIANDAITVLLIIYTFFQFFKKEKKYSKVIRMLCDIVAIVIVVVFEIPICISIDQFYLEMIFTIILLCLEFIIALIELDQLNKNK